MKHAGARVQSSDTDKDDDSTFWLDDFSVKAEKACKSKCPKGLPLIDCMKELSPADASVPQHSISEHAAPKFLEIIIGILRKGLHIERKSVLLFNTGSAFEAHPALYEFAKQSVDIQELLSELFSLDAAKAD